MAVKPTVKASFFTYLAAAMCTARSVSLSRPAHAKQCSCVYLWNVQGIKLELFIFDTFPLAERVALLEVHRDEEFAPVKNAPGAESDSPDTARQAILKLHTR